MRWVDGERWPPHFRATPCNSHALAPHFSRASRVRPLGRRAAGLFPRTSSARHSAVRTVRFRVGAWFRLLAPSLILLLAVLHVGEPLLKAAPLTHDHPTHLFKAWHMATEMLSSFRLRGFSHFWVFGYPSDELVPPGEELWVLLFRLLTFGKLTWLRTYGFALFGLLALTAFSTFRFTRQYFGTVAGVVAGLLMLWDPGGWAQGGWEWCIDFGVWPVTLGASCILMALVSVEKLLARGTSRQFLFAGLWVAAAYISHQVTILFLPVMVGLLLCDHWLRRAEPNLRLGLAVLACVFGTALAGFYLIPMLARSEQTLDLGVAGTSTEDIARRLVDLRLFAGGWSAFVVLGFVGAINGLRRRVPGAFFLAAGTGLFVLLSTDLPISALHVERLMPNLCKIEAQRMLYGAKLLWFPLVAYAISLPLEGYGEVVQRFRRRPLRALQGLWTRWNVGAALCLALLIPYFEPAYHQLKTALIDKKVPNEAVPFWTDLQLVWAHTARLRAQSREHYRIAYDLPMHDHLSTISPVFDNTFMYKVGYTPTQLFVGFPMYSDARLYRAACVKYVVSDHALDRSAFTHLRDFGSLKLYSFNEFDPNPFSVIGGGKGELVEFSPERIRVRLTGTGAQSRLKLHVSYIDHWRARLGGKTLRIVPATVFDAEDPILMEVPASDGELVFEYVRRAPDWLGLFLTLSALPLFFWGRSIARRRPAWAHFPELAGRVRRGLWVLAALSSLGIAALLVVRFRTRTALVADDSLFRGLRDGDMKVNGQPCKADGAFRWICGGSYPLKAERVSGLYGTHICMNTSGNSLELRTSRQVGEFLLGRYDVREGSGSLSAWLDDRELGTVGARPTSQGLQFLQFDTRGQTGTRGTFRIEMSGSPLHCFDFRVPL
jgi:hypothetical protein